MSDSQVYARKLFARKYGYPLYIPEPSSTLPLDFIKRGVSVGDVGIISQDGSFDFAFSLCAPGPGGTSDDINCYGVPNGFQQMTIVPDYQMRRVDNRYEKGTEVLSSSIKRVNIDVSGGLKENTLVNVPAGIDVGYTLTPSHTEAAVLIMPDGATSEDYMALGELRRYAIKHAVSWYEFINDKLMREAPNGSLYLVTGCDKSTTWGLATVSYGSPEPPNSLALRFTTTQLVKASATYTCSWQTCYPGSVRTGPDFGDGVQLDRNQCLFVRGFKIMIQPKPTRKSVTAAKVITTAKMTSDDLFPWATTSWCPGADGPILPDAGSGQQQMDDSSECWEDDDDDDDDYGWSFDDPDTGVYHPLDSINRYLLDKTGARVAITHESDWWPLSHGDNLSSDDEMLERLCSHYQPCVEDDGVFLVPLEKSLGVP